MLCVVCCVMCVYVCCVLCGVCFFVVVDRGVAEVAVSVPDYRYVDDVVTPHLNTVIGYRCIS